MRSRTCASSSGIAGGLRRVVRLDDGVDAPPPLLVRHADHRDVGDRRMLAQGRLHLGGIDIGAARDDHVDAPVGDVEIAVRRRASRGRRGCRSRPR